MTRPDRIVGLTPTCQFAEVGGVIAYGPNVASSHRRPVAYVDTILLRIYCHRDCVGPR